MIASLPILSNHCPIKDMWTVTKLGAAHTPFHKAIPGSIGRFDETGLISTA